MNSIGQLWYKSEGIRGIAELLSYFPERLQPEITQSFAELYHKFYPQLNEEEKLDVDGTDKQIYLPDDGVILEDLLADIEEKENSLESYISGYYSPEATRERFKSQPALLENLLADHETAKETLKSDLGKLREQVLNLNNETESDENLLLFK